MSKAYCVKCRTKTEIVDTEEEITSDGRRAIKGRCGVCEEPVLKMENLDLPEMTLVDPISGTGVPATPERSEQPGMSRQDSQPMMRSSSRNLSRLQPQLPTRRRVPPAVLRFFKNPSNTLKPLSTAAS